jgi:hypothetical protein
MKFKKPSNISQRVSSVTNSFVQAVIPWVAPTPEQRSEALRVLGMHEKIVCCYCGDAAAGWDHLYPLVRDKRPTGYISDYRNMVPACARCNSSKGKSDWRVWITGSAPNSPTSRGVHDVDQRIAALDCFEKWGAVLPIAIEQLASPELWSKHWENLRRLEEALLDAQKHAAVLQEEVRSRFGSQTVFATTDLGVSAE